MRNFYVLTAALAYIELHVRENFRMEDVAATCAMSLSGLQSLFTAAFGYSLMDYAAKRRHSHARHDLVYTDRSVLEIALSYGYSSHESFTRAFRRQCGETPSAFRKRSRFTELYPKIELNEGGKDMRKTDVSELYAELKKLHGSCVLWLDIVYFKGVNDTYGFAVGDAVLARCAERIENEIGEDMLFFRVGRDEFVVVTRLYEEADARAIADKIFAHNGETVRACGRDVPLSMRGGILRVPDGELSYFEVLEEMQRVLGCVRETESRECRT